MLTPRPARIYQAVGSDNRTRWPLNNHTPNKGWLAARRNVLPAGPTPNTWRYPYGTVLDIVLQNFPAGNRVVEQHPWHLHGHSFYVLGYGPGRFNRTEHEVGAARLIRGRGSELDSNFSGKSSGKTRTSVLYKDRLFSTHFWYNYKIHYYIIAISLSLISYNGEFFMFFNINILLTSYLLWLFLVVGYADNAMQLSCAQLDTDTPGFAAASH